MYTLTDKLVSYHHHCVFSIHQMFTNIFIINLDKGKKEEEEEDDDEDEEKT